MGAGNRRAAAIGARMILQVHDELIFEVEEGKADKVQREVRETMESIVNWKVKLKVNTGSGHSWDDAHA